MSPVAVCEDLAPNVLCHHRPALQVHVDGGDGRALCTLQLLIRHALGCGLQSFHTMLHTMLSMDVGVPLVTVAQQSKQVLQPTS